MVYYNLLYYANDCACTSSGYIKQCVCLSPIVQSFQTSCSHTLDYYSLAVCHANGMIHDYMCSLLCHVLLVMCVRVCVCVCVCARARASVCDREECHYVCMCVCVCVYVWVWVHKYLVQRVK